MTNLRRFGPAIARRYPILPFRGRLPLFPWSVDDMPEDVVVKAHPGIFIRVHKDLMYHNVYFWGDYEPFNTKVFRRIIHPGYTVMDVGANFGWFTTLFARWVGAAGRVHAFEPVPFIHDLAADTLDLNDLSSRVRLNRLAVGRSPGSMTLRTYAGLPHGHATGADLDRSDAVTYSSVVTTIDTYCEEQAVETIDFMKVDVEGFESDVFAGATRLLSSSASPIVAFEINEVCLQARSLSPTDVVNELCQVGYSHFFSLSVRHGVRRVASAQLRHGDWIAAKPSQLPLLEHALRTGRLVR